jgi:hypothetical protein
MPALRCSRAPLPQFNSLADMFQKFLSVNQNED